MTPDPLPTPLEREELDWLAVLAALTELVSFHCTARIYPTATSAPLVTLSGLFTRTFEPFGLDAGPLFLILGDGLLTLDPRDFEFGYREVGTMPQEACSVSVLEIAVRGGSLVEVEACLPL